MKKPFSFDQRSDTVFCSNPKCAQVRGAEGVSRMPIKKNVVARHADDKVHLCYDCGVFDRTGKNRHQRKAAVVQRKSVRVAARQKKAFKTMTAMV